MTPRQIDPGHPKKRHVLRVVGPVVLALGVILTAISVLTVIMGDPFEHPGRAALAFAGMPLMFVGTVLSMLGFGGALARYQAGEYAPVAKDTVNYMAEGTKDSVRTIAAAVGAGLRGGIDTDQLTCPGCGEANEAGSKFCDQCGKALNQG